LRRTSSFYPNRGATGNSLAASNLYPSVASDNEFDNSDESNVESESDWLDEPRQGKANEVAPRQASKFSAGLVIERPSWRVSTTMDHSMSVVQPENDHADASQAGHKSGTVDAPDVSQFTWPLDTEIVVSPGSKIRLWDQSDSLRFVLHDAMDRVHADLLFESAYPERRYHAVIMKTSLLDAASRRVDTSSIRRRLLFDEAYSEKLYPLLRARIPLFRSEVKDRCSAIISIEMLAINSDIEVMSHVDRQLSRYNYIFPTEVVNNPKSTARQQRYRNHRLIAIMKELYFTSTGVGGTSSFVQRFKDKFPTHMGPDGFIVPEVPIAMVALVATGLYAALREWRTGTHQREPFSANSCLDAYLGHIGTLNNLQETKNNAFHLMMQDIYSRASPNSSEAGNIQIAEFEIDEIDG